MSNHQVLSCKNHHRFAGKFCLRFFLFAAFPALLLALGARSEHVQPVSQTVYTQVTQGQWHTCALVSGGGVQCWGQNKEGQLGDGSTTSSRFPVTVPGLTGVTAVNAGLMHTCALLDGGGVQCWGQNLFGQLGNGTRTNSRTPVAVTGLTGVVAISGGIGHSCALISDGTIKCWGWNSHGQLGNGSSANGRYFLNSSTPVAVTGLTGVTAISVGGYYTCALLSGGTVQCWGRNDSGQLGNGSTTDSPTPVAVAGLTGVTAISTGSEHACALLNGGVVQCWGANFASQLGPHGNTPWNTTPVAVTGLTGVTAISSQGGGASHTCALLNGGTVECWGFNYFGELGDGNHVSESRTPVAVKNLTGVTAISAGSVHTCAVLSSGAVKCWGQNYEGQLGDGTTTGRTTPVAVAPPRR